MKLSFISHGDATQFSIGDWPVSVWLAFSQGVKQTDVIGSPSMYFIFSSLVGAPTEEIIKFLAQMPSLSLEHTRVTEKNQVSMLPLCEFYGCTE